MLESNIDPSCTELIGGTVVRRSILPIIHTPIWDLGVPMAIVVLTALRIYKYSLIKKDYNEQRVCMALFTLCLSWYTIFLLQATHVTEIQAKDTILLIFMLTYQDEVRCCVIRMCKMVHIGFEVVLFYILLTLFFGIFNRVTFYHFTQKDIQSNEFIWSSFGNRDLPHALLTIFSFTPGSAFPDLMVSMFKVNRVSGWIIPIEMFVRGGIMLAIVQSSLYFYYQNFYIKTMATLQKEERLYFLISREFNELGDVPPAQLLDYIVVKYSENAAHSFSTDEHFYKIKEKMQEEVQTAEAKRAVRKCFYTENFQHIRDV